VECAPGLFSSTLEAASCTPCETGHYAAVPGSAMCSTCPSACTRIARDSRRACRACPAAIPTSRRRVVWRMRARLVLGPWRSLLHGLSGGPVRGGRGKRHVCGLSGGQALGQRRCHVYGLRGGTLRGLRRQRGMHGVRAGTVLEGGCGRLHRVSRRQRRQPPGQRVLHRLQSRQLRPGRGGRPALRVPRGRSRPFVGSAECLACGANGRPNPSRTACVCDFGFYSPDGALECVACPRGGACEQTGTLFP
jgi:hypothetical protein